MALQTLTSSSAFPQDTTTATNTTTTTPSEPNLNLDGRNSIPFTFLVAFLALFVTFMTAGLCARRVVYFVRVQLGLPIPEPRQRPSAARPKKPVLWDMYPERRRDVRAWAQMDPLSCWFLRHADPAQEEAAAAANSHRADNAQNTPVPVLHHTHIPGTRAGGMRITPLPPLPPPRPRPTPSRTHTLPRTRTLNPVHALRAFYQELFHPVIPPCASAEIAAVRLAVLVAMPSVDSRWREKARMSTGTSGSAGDSEEGEQVGEMALGITELPWPWGEGAVGGGPEKA